MNKREQLIWKTARWIGVEEGCTMPTWLVVLAMVLLPHRFIWWIAGRFYNPYTDVFTLYGMSYSGRIFTRLAYSNEWFRIVKRESGIFMFEVCHELPEIDAHE